MMAMPAGTPPEGDALLIVFERDGADDAPLAPC